MKYLSKCQTKKTIYSKLYNKTENHGTSHRELVVIKPTLPISKYGVKLCTWSRNFDFTPFSFPKDKIALSKPNFVTLEI